MSERQPEVKTEPEKDSAAAQKQPEISDADIIAYEQQVKEEEALTRPLVGPLEPLQDLRAEYEHGSPVFLDKINHLSVQHDQFRRCRGDGNCFFRAFAYRYFELMRHGGINTALNDIADHGKILEAAGFQSLAYSDFQEEYTTLLQIAPSLDDAGLERQFNDPVVSNSIVVYLRFLASAYLKQNAVLYEPFLDIGQDMWQYCQANVEAMDREADEIHIIGLTNAMKQSVKIAYLNAAAGSHVNFHEFLPNEQPSEPHPPICLLYRPGHYDILYEQK